MLFNLQRGLDIGSDNQLNKRESGYLEKPSD
jgi:hypothetical protein